jgi:dethiobiotin synthetase
MGLAMAKIIFITGTDTGVGKTVVTGLLLHYLRESGCNALAIKPFCSGSRGDARLLLSLEKGLLALDEINPFFFRQAVAPGAAAGRRKLISLDSVLGKISDISGRCDVLLVEGVGGLMVPLAPNFTVMDLIGGLGCPTLVVSRNRLGTINHTLLSVKALQGVGIKRLGIIMVEGKKPDISARSNVKMIKKMAPLAPIFSIPDLGFGASTERGIKINVKFMKIILARILADDIFTSFFR